MKYLLSICIAILSVQSSFSQKKAFEEVSIDEIITETQYGSDSSDDLELIWWVPTEYWNIVFAQDNTASDAESEAIIEMVEDYVLVMAIKGKIGLFGGITYDTKETIQSILEVTYQGGKLRMLNDKDLSPDLVSFISLIQPMMKNMMGPMGENMQIFMFQNPEGKSVLPINPYEQNDLAFKLGTFNKNVSLPLGSLLEQKTCPEDSQKHSGKWTFCPYHGIKLVTTK